MMIESMSQLRSVECPLVAMNGSQGRQILSLLYTQLRTFTWPSLTSVVDPKATLRIMSYGPSGRYRSEGLRPHCLLHFQDQLAAYVARFAFNLGLGGILDGHALDLGQLDRSLHQHGRQLA